MWAREDSAGLLVQALITLARDVDAEVVRALDREWVVKHRQNHFPDVLEYIRSHALPLGVSAVDVAVEDNDEEGGGEGNGRDATADDSAVEEIATEFSRLINVTAPEEARETLPVDEKE